LQQVQQGRVGALLAPGLEQIGVQVVVLVFGMLFLHLRDQKLELCLADLADVLAGLGVE
jgi:hypothetical protein